MSDDVLKIDLPFEEAIRRFFDNCPGVRPEQKTHFGTVKWVQSATRAECLVCPYCDSAVVKDELHKCHVSGRTYQVPSGERLMARSAPKGERKP